MGPVQYIEKSRPATKTLAVNPVLDALLDVLRDPKGIYTDAQKLQTLKDIQNLYSTSTITNEDVGQTLQVFADLLSRSSKVGDEVKSTTCDVIWRFGRYFDETHDTFALSTLAGVIGDTGQSVSLRLSAINSLFNLSTGRTLSEASLNAFLPTLLSILNDAHENREVVASALTIAALAFHWVSGVFKNLSEEQVRQLLDATCQAVNNFSYDAGVCGYAAHSIYAFFNSAYGKVTYGPDDTKKALAALSGIIDANPDASGSVGSFGSFNAFDALGMIFYGRTEVDNSSAVVDNSDVKQTLGILKSYCQKAPQPLDNLSRVIVPLTTPNRILLLYDDITDITDLLVQFIPNSEFDYYLIPVIINLTKPRRLPSPQIDRLLARLDKAKEDGQADPNVLDLTTLLLLALEPARMVNLKYSSRFDLDATTFGSMIAKAPDWPCHIQPPDEPGGAASEQKVHYIPDLQAIIQLAKDHPGEHRAQTLYEGAGWVYDSIHTSKYYDYLFRFLTGQINISNKELFINFLGTRGCFDSFVRSIDATADAAFNEHGGTPEKNYSDGEIFFLSIQPGNTDELARIRKWLGEHIKDGNKPFLSARKFSMFMFSMHGSPERMVMNIGEGGGQVGITDYSKYLILRDNPEFLKIIGQDWIEPPSSSLPYYYPVGVNNACATGLGDYTSLAQAMADNVPAVVVAATTTAYALDHLPFKKTQKGWTLELLETAGNYENLTNPKVFYPRSTTGVWDDFHLTESGLLPNFPNPFSGYTQILFHLSKAGNVSIEIYDSSGQKVATPLESSPRQAGEDSILFESGAMANGNYFVRLKVDGQYVSKALPIEKVR
ncbi:MAG: T9SS type A sorting domain-containing protein [Candidatus Micrarchaeota archaeon]